MPMLKQIYLAYLRPFIEKETHNLNFKYASLLTTRLVALHVPALFRHFKLIGFYHDFYLVQWVMTLFAHTLPIPQVVQLWTYLFTQKVEFLFFITTAILKQLSDRLIEMDLNATLQVINNIAGLVCIKKLIKDALDMMEKCPQSFIAGDFLLDVDSYVKEVEALSHQEFFARRWWQLECLDYRPEIELCLL